MHRRSSSVIKRPGRKARIVIRYALLQVPGVLVLILALRLVHRWVDLPVWFVWGLVGLWLAKDAILFPFTWRAYDWDSPAGANTMVGLRGIAQERLAPSGYVRVRGELWRAEILAGTPPVDRGEAVRVLEVHGLKLLVQSDRKESSR